MAWTALMTFTANSVLTAAQLNTYIGSGGNLSHTAPAVVTTAGDMVYGTAANTITRLAAGSAGDHMVMGASSVPAWRDATHASVTNSQTTTSTAYTDLSTSGPGVIVTTGTKALVGWSAQASNSGANSSFMGCEVSGASALSADNTRAMLNAGTSDAQLSFVTMYSTLTAGSNTFTCKYRVSAGTGTWLNRRIWVVAF